jgi:multimeric flavodoxin WrbA
MLSRLCRYPGSVYMKKTIVIVFHSGYGHTRKIAEAAAFTNAASVSGDKQTTLYTMFTPAQQHGMLWVGTGLMPSNAKDARRDDVDYLSSFAGLATATPSDASAEEMVIGGIRTAILFGQRLRAAAARLA